MSNNIEETASENIDVVDDIAALLVRADDGDIGAEQELLTRYREDDRLHPGRRVMSFSPTGTVYDVDLETHTSMRLD
jgi:hypothetical protein